jgi:hypothetical protein
MANIQKRAPKKGAIDYKNGKIYKIVNDVNDNIYVGSTISTLTRRFSQHKGDSKNITKQKRKFYAAVNLIGFDHFRIILIENFASLEKRARISNGDVLAMCLI